MGNEKTDLDLTYIQSLIQNVLIKTFSSKNKRIIHEYEDRMNFACPVCGDSKNEYKKRGNIYFSNLKIVCYNCDYKAPLDIFLRKFNEAIDPSKKLEIINYLDSVIKYKDYQDDYLDATMLDMIPLNDLIQAINNTDCVNLYDFTPIISNGGVEKYLIGRGIPKQLHHSIYQAKYGLGGEKFEHVICFLNKKDDKVLGLQIRNLKSGKKRFFKIYNWETLMKWVNGEEYDLEINKTIIYNKLSYFFNILNVDFNRIITIFEGYLDSLFYPNSIGIVGVNTDVSILEDNNIDIQFFFDNDSAGFDKSVDKLKKGYKVFLWKSFFEFIIENKKDIDPYQLYARISKVKDLNKLAEITANPYNKFKLNNFFSKDKFDIRYLPKKTSYKDNFKNKEIDYNKSFKYLSGL